MARACGCHGVTPGAIPTPLPDAGWKFGAIHGRSGLFPAEFVQPVAAPDFVHLPVGRKEEPGDKQGRVAASGAVAMAVASTAVAQELDRKTEVSVALGLLLVHGASYALCPVLAMPCAYPSFLQGSPTSTAFPEGPESDSSEQLGDGTETCPMLAFAKRYFRAAQRGTT